MEVKRAVGVDVAEKVWEGEGDVRSENEVVKVRKGGNGLEAFGRE